MDEKTLLIHGHTDHGLEVEDAFPEIIGRSEPMVELLSNVRKSAISDSSVLIFGESGTGKELIAAALHRLSPRAQRSFIPINCSAIPEALLESELFGHERGAFTGASQRRIGHFEAAQGGTIFLDEIGDMPLNLQVKLLRVLQEKQFCSIGSSVLRTADIRVIAATNVDLAVALRENRFRLDLFYRLNVLPLTVPALRQRGGDIALLLDHFFAIANRQYPFSQASYLSGEARRCLLDYGWPGNVRELQNLVERLVIMSGGGAISKSMLPPEYARAGQGASQFSAQGLSGINGLVPVPGPKLAEGPLDTVGINSSPRQEDIPDDSIMSGAFQPLDATGLDLNGVIEKIENHYILEALSLTNNNKNQAAKLLGLNRTTLVERIKKRKLVPLNPPSKEL